MKIKGFFISDKNYLLKKTGIMLMIFTVGIICGAVYCTLLPTQSDDSVYTYLSGFFGRISSHTDYIGTLKTSLFENIRLFFFILVCSLVRPGFLGITGAVMVKGFISGFAAGSFIKYYGTKGLLINLCSLPSSLIFLPSLLLFSASSVILSQNRRTADKKLLKMYTLLAICCLTTFCISSLADTVITTTFMKLLSEFFTNN